MKRLILVLFILFTLMMFFSKSYAPTHDPWDGTGWDTTAPDVLQPIGNHYKEMYDLRKGIAVRMNKGHQDMAASSVGGWHTWGSAVCYWGPSDPCNRPDNATSLDDATTEDFSPDKGRLYINTNYFPNLLERWNGSAWEDMAMLDAGSAPQAFMHNDTHEDTEGGRESSIRFYGEQSGAERTTLGFLEFSHDGTSDDEKGKFRIAINDGDDANAPSKDVLKIGSDELIELSGALTVTGAVTASSTVAITSTLDVTGNIDPTSYETTNGGFLDEDSMSSDSATAVASQQSIKAYVATQKQDMNDIFGERTTKDSGGSDDLAKTEIYKVTSDGVLTVYDDDSDNAIYVYAEEDDSTPDVIRGIGPYVGSTHSSMAVVHIKKDEYFQVSCATNVTRIEWMAIGDGTGACVKQ